MIYIIICYSFISKSFILVPTSIRFVPQLLFGFNNQYPAVIKIILVTTQQHGKTVNKRGKSFIFYLFLKKKQTNKQFVPQTCPKSWIVKKKIKLSHFRGINSR